MNKQDNQELRTNKQELISKYELIKNSYKFDTVSTDGIISDLKRLDEPQKVTIPQFVADWIEECGTKEKSLLTAILYTPEKVNSWVGDSDNQELFARAWLDGYTIEEKRYKVKMKAIKSNSQYLIFGQLSGTWWFGSAEQIGNVKSEHTRKELEEAGFGWVFDCPGVQIEEVID